MNEVLKDVEELKIKITGTKEYKDYKKYLDLLDTNIDIKNLINKIVVNQKKLVNLKSNKKDCTFLEEELNQLYTKLNNYDDYNNYIKASKKLNILLTKIQKNFNDYFDSLVK